MVKLRPVAAALKRKVYLTALNPNKKPRHIDNGILALSWTCRLILGTRKRARMVNVNDLERILEDKYYSGPNRQLGPGFVKCFKRSLPDLVEKGYIRWNADKTKFRVSGMLFKLCMEAAVRTPGDEIERHRAICDYFRQKMSPLRRTNAMVCVYVWNMENHGLTRSISRDQLEAELNDKDQQYEALEEKYNELAGISRADQAGSSVFREGSIESFEDDEDEDVEMNEDGGPPRHPLAIEETVEEPVAGPSSSPPTTPIKHPRPDPVGFYPTPQSLPHPRLGARPPPPLSPSPGRDSFSSRGITHDDNMDVDMDIDEDPVAGPSGTSSSTLLSHKSVGTEFAPDNTADLQRLAMVVQAPEATFQSIEETCRAREEMNRAREDADCTRILALEEREKELEETHRAVLETHHAIGEADSARILVLEEEARELKELVETHCARVLELEEGQREDREANHAQTTALREAREHAEKLAAVLREKEEDIENLKEELMVTTQLRDDARSARDAAEARAETSRRAHEAAIAESRAEAETVTRAQFDKDNEKEAHLKRLAERRLARNT
ncbi:hypothetical protein DXG01_015036 [Tephrocybe rancida]|nr:hypothetical protein DXG01_015036 [Tephrocybe rancida]